MNNMLKNEIVNHYFEKCLCMKVNKKVAIEIYKLINKFKNENCVDTFFKTVVTDIHEVIKDDNANYKEWINAFYNAVIAEYDDQRIDTIDMLDDYLNYSDKEWIIKALLSSEGSYKDSECFYIDNTYENIIFLNENEEHEEKEDRVIDCIENNVYRDLEDLDKWNDLYDCINAIYQFIYSYNLNEYRIIKWFNKPLNKYDYYILENVIDDHRLVFTNLKKEVC